MSSILIRCVSPFDGVEGTALYKCYDGDTAVPGPRVAIVGLMHGNEPVGGAVISRLEKVIYENLRCGSVLTVRANLAAEALNLRHLEDGVDMNRQWDTDSLARLKALPVRELCYEEKRVLHLAPILLGCDVVLDIHSTSRPSPACLLFRDDQRHASIATQLNVKYLVTGLHESAILDGGMCSNLGLRGGEYSERVGFTFEAGEHTNEENPDRGWDVTLRLLAVLGMWSDPVDEVEDTPQVYEVMERFRQAPKGTTPYRFVGYQGGEVGSERRGAPRTLASFEEVEADEILVRRGVGDEVRAQAPFTILMPAPTAAPGTDLFYVTQRRHGGISFGQAKTNAEANREAMAVERMMDLLGDDDFERGCTWVCFESRRALDICADMVGRALRMDKKNPHRKITVVGRGDWGGDESELRAGQRYRQVMRRAIVEGLSVERIQLFRGASLGWLDLLTSGSVAHMAAEGDGSVGSLSLYLSMKQPHTVSVLVIGDIEQALKQGNVRDIRVAVLIEAATVEPDGPTARVRVARCGMYSSRTEFLSSVSQLINSLKDEHHRLVDQANLFNDQSINSLGANGGIAASTDPLTINRLRERLCRMQLEQWTQQLRAEITGTIVLESDEALGKWLTNLMVRTDILDVQALKKLLVRPTQTGWIADCSQLDSFVNDPLRLLPSVNRGKAKRPEQSIFGADVHRDNLERWVGWKRFVHGAQSIPGQRGKDLDVVFREDEIQRRIARWFRKANRMGNDTPGDVRVVLAGDGMTPVREREGNAWDVVVAHRDLITNSNISYLRIQHTCGTNFSWMKDTCGLLLSRKAGEPAAIQWEEAHGAVVNIVLICTRIKGASPVSEVWSLDAWKIEACSVLLSDLHESGLAYKLALFTESIGGAPPSQELMHFGRSHCEGLLRQGGIRAMETEGDDSRLRFDHAIVPQLERWVRRILGAGYTTDLSNFESDEEREQWVMEELGIVDRTLASALVKSMNESGTAEEAARRVWEGIRPWPGSLWARRGVNK